MTKNDQCQNLDYEDLPESVKAYVRTQERHAFAAFCKVFADKALSVAEDEQSHYYDNPFSTAKPGDFGEIASLLIAKGLRYKLSSAFYNAAARALPTGRMKQALHERSNASSVKLADAFAAHLSIMRTPARVAQLMPRALVNEHFAQMSRDYGCRNLESVIRAGAQDPSLHMIAPNRI